MADTQNEPFFFVKEFLRPKDKQLVKENWSLTLFFLYSVFTQCLCAIKIHLNTHTHRGQLY